MDQVEKTGKENPEGAVPEKFDYNQCPNCGATLKGKYCSDCGQLNKDYDKPIKEILSEIFSSINIDRRLVNTLIPFFFRPGYLSEQYFLGRRRRYVPPMRMYLFMSVIFFFIANFKAERVSPDLAENFIVINDDDKAEKVDSLIQNEFDEQVDKEKIENLIIGNRKQNENYDSLRHSILFDIDRDTLLSDSEKRMVKGSLTIKDNYKLFMSRFFNNLSYLIFLLMPIFAFILMLFHLRKEMLYVRHLIFSINFHSFLFGVLSVYLLIGTVVPESWLKFITWMIALIPVYLIFGMARFYAQGIVVSLFKTLAMFIIYALIVLLSLLVIFLTTASGLVH